LEGLGQALREARERRNISLEEAERATKVRRVFLEALETEQYEHLPARAYTQGLLTLYARYLGLDAVRLATMLPPAADDLHAADSLPSPARELPVGLIVLLLLIAMLAATGVCVWRGAVSAAGPRVETPPELTSTPTAAQVNQPAAAPAVQATPSATGAATSVATPRATERPAASPTVTPTPTATPLTSAPALTGLTWQQASEQATAAGLTPKRQEQNSDAAPLEQVIAQQPAAGQPLGADRTVTLVVSIGKPAKEVPNVVGRTEAEARRLLTEAGLPPARFSNYQGHSDVPETVLRGVCVGCVLSTTPGPGTRVAPDTQVYLAVRRD